VVSRHGVGYDNVDIKALTDRGIPLALAVGGNAVSVAEQAMHLMLTLTKQGFLYHQAVREGQFDHRQRPSTSCLEGKSILIIGFGRTGSRVAARAAAFDMKLYALDPYINPDIIRRAGGTVVTDLTAALPHMDMVTIHCPKTPETRGLIGHAALNAMKSSAILINTARGGIVNEKDIVEGIKKGKIGGVALDVFESEPPDFKSPIFNQDNKIIFTPHLGASTQEAQMKVGIAMAEQIIEYVNDGVVTNAVNMHSMSHDILTEMQPFLELSEKLGNFMGQICKSGVKEIILEYSGNVSEMNVAPLTVSALKGYLSPIMSAPVTYVNAPLIAEERGIKLKEAKVTSEEDFSSLVTLIIKSESGDFSVSGSIFGKKEPRFTKLNQHTIDVIPKGNVLIIENDDKPGVIGLLGDALGKRNINIGRLYLSRKNNSTDTESALAFISVDSPVSEETLENIANLPQVKSIEQVIF